MANKTRKNQFDVEWQYAKAVWTAFVNMESLPPVPHFSVWEINEANGKEKLIKTFPCNPMKVTFQGRTNI